MNIEEMRARVFRHDNAAADKVTLETEIASLEAALANKPATSVEWVEGWINGRRERLINYPVLTVGEIAQALLPELRAKLAKVNEELEQLK